MKVLKKLFPLPKKGPIQNRHMASFFFAMFLMFFFIFIANKYTMNLIMAGIMLIFSVSFKTWQLIRDLEERLYE